MPQGHPPFASPHLAQMLLGQWAALVAVVVEATAAFPSPLVIKEESESLSRNCSVSPGEHVEWRQNGQPRENSSRELVIDSLDIPHAGNYSCWAGSRLVQSFYLAIRMDHSHFIKAEGSKERPAITCWAPSYSGTLNCFWKSQKAATFLVHLKHRDSGAELCSTEVALPGHQDVQIQLKNCSLCPHAEETPATPLRLVLQALSALDGMYAEAFKTFLLRDIVRPDAPAYLNVTGGKVSWAPPASWDLPTTYFPLRYHLRLESAAGRQELYPLAEKEWVTGKNWHKAQIRCQDALTTSSWSPWREWKK
ncbi:interleukin-12 subunit beta-like isoform X2 [Erythrolamprus reginae]|uniref:interleukin-12 subunit beta-like isoform X2 n=1 Tax=Erythrolamprus reginae TaxID=121349 RepID=UPI00396C6A65